jgi:hypothetical protein
MEGYRRILVQALSAQEGGSMEWKESHGVRYDNQPKASKAISDNY